MIKSAGKVGLAMGALLAMSSAHAIDFFNIKIFGSPDLVGTVGPSGSGSDSTWHTGANGKDIDFSLLKAKVGDGEKLEFGVVNITFEAKADQAIYLDALTLSFNNLVLGSGNIRFTEIVEDVINPGIIANHTVDITTANQGSYSKELMFSRASKHIKVKKTIYLDAPNVPNQLDKAAMGLIEQKMKCVPEPISMIAMAGGLAGLALKKRKVSR